jgi:hypothetical protein
MKRVGFFAGAALSLALASTASAQLQGNVCQVGSTGSNGNGTAIIANPGLNGSAPQSLPFAFSETCGSGTATQGCARGVLAIATCGENVHSGDSVYCPTGSCSLDCGGPCNPTNVQNATFLTTSDCYPLTFEGVCVANLCVGSATADVVYALLFSQATSEAALATCPPAPLGTGGSLTEASFSGVVVY